MIVDPKAPDFEQSTQKRIYGCSFEYLVRDWINYNYSNWEQAKKYMEHNGEYLWNQAPMYSSRPNLNFQLGLACIEQVLKNAANARPRGPLDELVAFVEKHNRRDCIINAIAVPAMMVCERHSFTTEKRLTSVRKTFKATLPLVAYLSEEEKSTVRNMVATRATNTQLYLQVWDDYFAHKEKMRLSKAVKSKIKSSAVAPRKM